MGYFGTGNVPNFDGFLATAWGAGSEYSSAYGWACGATNLVFGTNPPYYLDDFLSIYPKFFGAPTLLSGCGTTAGSTLVSVPSFNGLLYGQFVQSAGVLSPGSVIAGLMSGVVSQVSTHSEAPVGVVPGMLFTLSAAPPTGVLQILSKNGAYQTPGVDYTLTGNEITMATPMMMGDALYATWLLVGQLVPVHGEVPMGAVPGNTFTLSSAPPNGVLQTLTTGGQFLTAGIDYTLTGTTITLTAPLTSGTLYAAWYLPTGYSITLNAPALVTSSNATLLVYQSSPIPTAVIQLYLNLAAASLIQARWQEQWYVAMGWFIAHYLTLYAKSDAAQIVEALETAVHGEAPVGIYPGAMYTLSAAPPGNFLQSLTKNGAFLTPGVDYTLSGASITLTTPTLVNDQLYATWPTQITTLSPGIATGASIAAQGLAGGIQASKSVGDVSVSYQTLSALEDWGQWNLTLYGQQLATMARVMGSGPMVIY